MGESQAECDRFAKMLKMQLGPQASKELPTLLMDNVPEIRTFLDESDGVVPDLRNNNSNSNSSNSSGNEISGNEIKMRFHSAFLEIFQVMVNFKFVTLVRIKIERDRKAKGTD